MISLGILGSPKRKIHRTLPSEFKMVRPRTRDLLLGSSLSPPQDQTDGKMSGRTSPRRAPAGRGNSPRRTPRGISSLFLIKPEGSGGKNSGKTKEGVVFPQLVTGSVKECPGQIKTQQILHLPQIH